MTIFGWDASDYDWGRGPMDLAAAARDGIVFFTHKATEGTGTRHRYYGEALNRARDAGIPVLGAYHVVRTSPSIASQVTYMLAYLDSQTPWWRAHPHFFIQVDLELWDYDKVPASVGEAFADAVQQASGKVAVIYASRGQYGNQLAGTSHELWNANYGSNPAVHFRQAYSARGGDGGPGWVTYSGRMPQIWQYGSRATIGSQTICDANAFRGTLAQLKELVNPHATDGDDEMKTMLVTGRNDPQGYVFLSNGMFRVHVGDVTETDAAVGDETVLRDVRWVSGANMLATLTSPAVTVVDDLDAFGAEVPRDWADRMTKLELGGIDPATLTEAIKTALLDPAVIGAIAAEVGKREAAADRARAEVLDGS
jgi:GH25 family lysozyme M1 (1,4-beta-N-acetylmuramidase)